MPLANHGRNSRAYRRRARRLRNSNPICWLCGEHIDTDLPPSHAMSFTADHVQPLNAGGDIHGELRPAHRSCNARRGDGTSGTGNTIAVKRSQAW